MASLAYELDVCSFLPGKYKLEKLKEIEELVAEAVVSRLDRPIGQRSDFNTERKHTIQ